MLLSYAYKSARFVCNSFNVIELETISNLHIHFIGKVFCQDLQDMPQIISYRAAFTNTMLLMNGAAECCLASNGNMFAMTWSTKPANLTTIIQSRRLSLLGHIARNAKKIPTAHPSENWRRPSGCTHITWLNTVQQDMRSHNLTMTDSATNHHLWSVEADVYVWLCALLVVHAKKEDIRKYDIDNNEIHKLYSICSVYLILIMYNLYNYNSRFHNTICNYQFAAPHQW